MMKLTFVFVLLSAISATALGDYCPCVPDFIRFEMDFSSGCDNNPLNNADFSKVKCWIQPGRLPSNKSITKVVMKDLQTGVVLEELDVVEHTKRGDTNSTAVYTFDYHRSFSSPSMLLLDFYQRASSKPVAMVDLYYRGRSVDCISSRNPLFWPGDKVYFLTVVGCCDGPIHSFLH